MALLNFKRLVSLPSTLEASTLYITKNAVSETLVDLTFVGSNVADVRRIYGAADTQAAIDTAIANLTAEQIPDLPGSKIISELSVDTTGNAATATRAETAALADEATKLATGRTINGVEFDGTQNIVISAVDTETPRVAQSELGVSVATLVNGKVPVAQLPTGLDNIDTYPSAADFPEVGTPDTIYIAEDNNQMYRYAGSEVGYIMIPSGASMADEAYKLAVARKIQLSGGVSGEVLFDGSADVNMTVTVDSVAGSAVQGDIAGNAATATRAQTAALADEASKLAQAVDITLEGAVAGTASFDGSGNVVIETAFTGPLVEGMTGTATKVVVENGLVKSAEALVEADIPNLSGDKITSAVAEAVYAQSAGGIELGAAEW